MPGAFAQGATEEQRALFSAPFAVLQGSMANSNESRDSESKKTERQQDDAMLEKLPKKAGGLNTDPYRIA
jgi:hypothetical protein